jgi:hypothetical protein
MRVVRAEVIEDFRPLPVATDGVRVEVLRLDIITGFSPLQKYGFCTNRTAIVCQVTSQWATLMP